ncbi:predicted protein [Naegleria gruberi]|uniref:Predicted protein n=1 Tax=Naegleria gruberi TaxID=5762 RepID=D2VRG8_NAEGR|nr:uncharacterized protein NAEGRDRAFT_71581 [Naegleria gruberi]EFC40671.1 predicted protein [Naegleria gruberi]|eukprot:XP_002673415.1 predicted protein [Naegleria gruberi strain NEG-M]
MQGNSSPSSLRPKEEAYVKSLLEKSRSRRRKKKEELRELQNSLFHFNDDGNYQEYDEESPVRSSSSRSRCFSPGGVRGINNSSGSWSVGGQSSSPEQQHYTNPTICSEVRKAATNYAHEQHKQLSEDIHASYLLKRMEELKSMNIKAMIDRSFNSSSCVTKDQSQQVCLANNYTSPTSPTKLNPNTVSQPLSPHSKQYEIERRKRVEARQEKLKNSPNTMEEKYLAVSQQSPPQKLKRPSSARPTTQQPQFQPNLIRSPEKFQSHSSQNSILNNSSRKHSQHAPDVSKTPEKLTSPTKLQRPSSAPRSRVVQSAVVETPKKTVPYNQRKVPKPLDPFEKEEKIILEQIQDLDDQLQKSVVFRSVVSSISDLPPKSVKSKENDSIISNRVTRPTTPSSSRRSNTRSPLSYSRCNNRPQSFETPKESSLEEIAKKNRERYGHVKSKVVSRRSEYSGAEQNTSLSQNRNQRPASALSGRGPTSSLPKHDEMSFSSTPKRPSSAPRKPRAEGVRDSHENVRSVNISLKNILLEQEEYKRVWGEIEEEELRILKFTPKSSQNNKSDRPEKDLNISVVNDNSNSFTKFDFGEDSESNFKSVMKKRIEEIEMGLKKIASLDTDENEDEHYEPIDKNETQDIESHYRILFDRKDYNQSGYPEESSQLIEIDLEQSKISSCGEEDTTTIIEEKVSNNIDAFLSHGETEKGESYRVNESILSSSFIGDTSQIPSNPEFRKFINDKLDMLEKECSLHQ